MSPSPVVSHVHIVVHGRVQGVGFRYFVTREAAHLGLRGLVRNRPDGTVEVEAEGSLAGLERLADAVRRGPVAARVEKVEEHFSEGPPRHRGFQGA